MNILLVDALAGARDAFWRRQRLGRDAFRRQLAAQFCCRTKTHEIGEHAPHYFSFCRVNDQLTVFHIIVQRRKAAHPQALFLAGGELVPNPFPRHFALELGEGQQKVQGQTPHRGGRVELLSDGDEGDAVPVKDLDDFGKTHQRARQAVDLVGDNGHRGIPLRVQRVIVLLQPLFRSICACKLHSAWERARSCFQSEENRPRPLRTGDVARDRRQAFKGLAVQLILAAWGHGHAVFDAVELARPNCRIL